MQMCAETQNEIDDLACLFKTGLGQPCEKSKAVDIKKEHKIIKPIMLMPLPSPNCETDWDYQMHGDNWQCRCKTGREQSPIDIPTTEILPLKYDAEFEFYKHPANALIIEY